MTVFCLHLRWELEEILVGNIMTEIKTEIFRYIFSLYLKPGPLGDLMHINDTFTLEIKLLVISYQQAMESQQLLTIEYSTLQIC